MLPRATLRPPPRIAPASEPLDNCHTGARPNNSPVARLRMAVNATTRRSSESARPAGNPPSGIRRGAMRIRIHARASPPAPPSADSSRLSVSTCLDSRAPPAPSAARTAISRARDAPRANIRLATLAHAINRMKSTTPDSTRLVVRNSVPTMDSRRGSMVTPQSLFVAGEIAAICAAITAMADRACSMVTPGLRRPSTCK